MGACRRVLVLAGLLLGLPLAASGNELDNDRIARHFGIIAFGDEFSQVQDPRLIRWATPIRVYTRIDAPVTAPDLAYLDGHLHRLSALTGLKIDQVKSEREANFVVVFTDEQKFRSLAVEQLEVPDGEHWAAMSRRIANSNCVAYFRSDNLSYTIHRATVLIPVDRAKARGIFGLCVVEETTQAMGLPNDSDDVNPSIFNDSSPLKDLTEHDILLLRMLYDPRMAPGMRPQEAIDVAHRILPQMRRLRPVMRPASAPQRSP